MAIEKKHEAEHENEERWLLTYSDLITLLMVFFVVMYSMSKSDAQKFQQMAETLKASFNNPLGSKHGVEAQIRNVMDVQQGSHRDNDGDRRENRMGGRGGGVHHGSEEIKKLKLQFQELMKRAEKAGAAVSVSLNKDETALIVRLSDSLLFDPGSADLAPDARKLMDGVADLLQSTEKQIRVEGHTDNIPINSAKYPSNWELSTARAVTVLRYMVDTHHLKPERLSAGGYGEFRPIAANDSPEHRSTNRRVEFVILDEAEASNDEVTTVSGSSPSAIDPTPPPVAKPAPEPAPSPNANGIPSASAVGSGV